MRSGTTRLRLLRSAAAATALMSVLGGCGGGHGPATDGPLGSNNTVSLGSQCVPGGHTWAFGFDQFTNHSHVTVILDRIALLDPHNERVVGSLAVPGDLFLGVTRWPPTNPGLPSTWKDRRPVHGLRLAPGKTFNLILGIAAIVKGHRATSQGESVYYHDSSGSFVTKSYSAMIIAVNTHTC